MDARCRCPMPSRMHQYKLVGLIVQLVCKKCHNRKVNFSSWSKAKPIGKVGTHWKVHWINENPVVIARKEHIMIYDSGGLGICFDGRKFEENTKANSVCLNPLWPSKVCCSLLNNLVHSQLWCHFIFQFEVARFSFQIPILVQRLPFVPRLTLSNDITAFKFFIQFIQFSQFCSN